MSSNRVLAATYDRGIMAFDVSPCAFEAGDEQLRRREKAKNMVSGLYSEWYSPLRRYAFRAVGSMEAAEDAVQDTFLELYRALLEGKVVTNPRGWTLCVVRRRIVDQRRREERHGGAFFPLSAASAVVKESAEALPSEWDDYRLTRLLSVLSRREEEVLLLRSGGMKYRQIAIQLKISINSVKTLLARSIRKMRQETITTVPGNRGSKHDDISETLQ